MHSIIQWPINESGLDVIQSEFGKMRNSWWCFMGNRMVLCSIELNELLMGGDDFLWIRVGPCLTNEIGCLNKKFAIFGQLTPVQYLYMTFKKK